MKCLTNSNQTKEQTTSTLRKHKIQLRLDKENTDIGISNRTLLTLDNSSYIIPKRIKKFKKDSKRNLNSLSIQTQKTNPKKTITNESKHLNILYKHKKNNESDKDKLNKKEEENVEFNDYTSILTENYFQCIFCEKFMKKDHNTNKIKCSHKFCHKCGKAYYEGKIEEGFYKQFKCCVYDCISRIDVDILYSLLSKPHLEIIKNKPKIKDNIIYSSNIDLQKYFDTNKIPVVKKYSLKHIIDVNTNQQFFQYNSSKQMACPHCYELALYGQTNQHFVKCFNCFYKLCKHCLLPFEDSHMNYTSDLRCKVYYRRKKTDSKSIFQVIKNVCSWMLLVIAGFVLMSSVGFVYTKNTLLIKNKFKRIVLFAVGLIVSIITMPIFLMSLPYYPILTCIL